MTAPTDRVLAATGDTLAEWKSIPWWPNETEVRVAAGYAGHDREITVNFSAYDGYEEQIPHMVFDVIVALCPEGWFVENRGSRIELHPSGRFAGGYSDADIETAKAALSQAGFLVA